MKSLLTYLKNFLKLYLIILIYSFALNCSKNETPSVENPLMSLTNDCSNGEIKNAQGLCVPKCNQNQVLKNNTCVNFSLPVDSDSNGLIDIYTLEDLYNVRFNLAGTSWKTSLTDTVWRTSGCPSNGCRGYELKANLDFSGTKWASNYTGTEWVTSGWDAIGNCGADNNCSSINDNRPFAATFNGNGFEIRNLYINKPTQVSVGLFGYISGTSTLINSVGVVKAYVKGLNYTGGLVGWQDGGIISNSYVSGSVSGRDNTGGLVGISYSSISSITNSYASGSVSGSGVSTGGLVGYQNGGSSVTNSYASGSVIGAYSTGGLVGWQERGSITNSYASGSVSCTVDNTGGLVGKSEGSISYSYASGSVSGSGGTNTGGLVGNQQSGSITNTYWNSMSDQTVAGVSRSEVERRGIGNKTWSTSSSSENGISALSTTKLQSNMNNANATILDISKFYTVPNYYPKLCYTPLPSGVACSATYRIPGQD